MLFRIDSFRLQTDQFERIRLFRNDRLDTRSKTPDVFRILNITSRNPTILTVREIAKSSL